MEGLLDSPLIFDIKIPGPIIIHKNHFFVLVSDLHKSACVGDRVLVEPDAMFEIAGRFRPDKWWLLPLEE